MEDRIIILPSEPCPPSVTTTDAVRTLVQQADDNRRSGVITPGQAVFGLALIGLGALVISGAFSRPAPPYDAVPDGNGRDDARGSNLGGAVTRR